MSGVKRKMVMKDGQGCGSDMRELSHGSLVRPLKGSGLSGGMKDSMQTLVEDIAFDFNIASRDCRKRVCEVCNAS